MRTIHKHRLQPGKTVINSFRDYKVLKADSVAEAGYVWLEVNTMNLPAEVVIEVYGTGHRLPTDANLRHIGTFMMLDGQLVWHAYEVRD